MPGINDDAKDEAYRLSMAKQALENIIAGIIVTPHQLNGVFRGTRESILNIVMAFAQEL